MRGSNTRFKFALSLLVGLLRVWWAGPGGVSGTPELLSLFFSDVIRFVDQCFVLAG